MESKVLETTDVAATTLAPPAISIISTSEQFLATFTGTKIDNFLA